MRGSRRRVLALLAAVAAIAFAMLVPPRVPIAASQTRDSKTESAAQFERMATVLQNPRCMNCHTREAFPRQGDDRHRHTMNVARGPDDRGASGLHCNACHQPMNQAASGVPGAPDWHLAPLRMAWEGLTVGELCRALMDPARGGVKPGQFVAHFNTGLVRWAWSPGTDAHGHSRAPPPLSHDAFIAITRRWIATGTACPDG